MMTPPKLDALDQALANAKAAGILPADAVRPGQDARPWPVVLLTALGAWLAAVPLLFVVGAFMGDFVTKSFGAYVVGVLVLAGALVVLRSRDLPVFVEQLAVPALLLGCGCLGLGLYRDLPPQAASLFMALLSAAVSALVPHAWLRVLLGAACAGFAAVAVAPMQIFESERTPVTTLWAMLHGLLALWLGMLVVQRRWLGHGAQAARAAALESFASGWVLAVLAGLCWLAGMTFLVGGSMSGFVGEITQAVAGHHGKGVHVVTQAGSAALTLLAAFWLVRQAPGLRQPLAGCVAAVLVALSWFLPTLGAAWLALALMATTQRWRLAGAAAVAAAWVIGSFYYQLAWPLTQKAMVLALAGAALGGLAWLAQRRPSVSTGTAAAAPRERRATAFIAAGAVVTLLVANFAIWQKQDLIANGRVVFVELAPVDPRSLMQGDFMRLGWRLPDNTSTALDPLFKVKRPHVVARVNEQGVATLVRIAETAEALLPGELRIELSPKDGRWVIVTDAWFFREGDGERWAVAKYGEFRVMPDGRALLVGMADSALKRIEP